MLTPFESRAARALAETPLFGALGPESMSCLHRSAVRKGELLFSKGDPSHHLYGLVSGPRKVFSNPEPGCELSLELVAPGELLGELGLEDGGPRYASVRALAHSELATIPRGKLLSLLDRKPELRAALGRAAANTAARLAQRAEDAAFLSIETRLEKALLDLAGRFGESVERGTRIRLRQQDLADILGVSRESVSRALAAPALRGRLALGRGSITLLR
jgi:CRP-like cAMP-binding protein